MERLKERFAWLFSGHYKMERFGVMFTALVVLLALAGGRIYMHKMKLENVKLGEQVTYTTDVTMSLTGNTGQVVNVFMDSSHTKAFVLLHWDDVTKVITDANDYEFFLTGSTMDMIPEPIACHPSGSIYMFGSTGYMGIYLVDTNGFPKQILYGILRCNSMAAPIAESRPTYDDSSFNEFDQCQIFFNPGASAYTPAAFLDEGRMDIYDIYEATVIDGQEEEIRSGLDDTLNSMQGALGRIDEYERRVRQDGIIVPDRPIQIRGDQVLADEAGDLYLQTDYVVQGGYSFDWRHGSVLEGYLESVVPDNSSPAQYLAMKAELVKSEPWSMGDVTWYRTDGTRWVSENPYNETTVAQTNADIQGLMNAWNEYFSLKQSYQAGQLDRLLRLELNIREMITRYSVHPGETAFHIW